MNLNWSIFYYIITPFSICQFKNDQTGGKLMYNKIKINERNKNDNDKDRDQQLIFRYKIYKSELRFIRII